MDARRDRPPLYSPRVMYHRACRLCGDEDAALTPLGFCVGCCLEGLTVPAERKPSARRRWPRLAAWLDALAATMAAVGLALLFLGLDDWIGLLP